MKCILILACLWCSTAMAQNNPPNGMTIDNGMNNYIEDIPRFKKTYNSTFTPIILSGIESSKPTDTLFSQSGNRVFKEVTTAYILKDKKSYIIKYSTVWNDIKGIWEFYSMQVLTEPKDNYTITTGTFRPGNLGLSW